MTNKILLAYPKFPISYWGFQHGLKLAGKKASLPPLGLISLAALLPKDWSVRLVDLNIQKLRDKDIRWADVVMVGGMRVQEESIHEVLARARAMGKRSVVGGPAPTTAPSEYADADLIFQGEAEGRIDSLVAALAAPVGQIRLLSPEPNSRPALEKAPIPRFDLLDYRQYTSMALQYSRGCPFNCEFCDIIEMFGRVPRLKTSDQVMAELEAIYQLGYRGSVFFVDDNFIGNKASVKRLTPLMSSWQKRRGHPFELYTEASVNLAADEQLLAGMVEAGFAAVFLGIETPSAEALKETGKNQNVHTDLTEAVLTITRAGIEVFGGFIVGFDSDKPDIFDLQREFISGVPIPLAMVGLLLALPQTALWRRLKREGRLKYRTNGDQFDGRLNFHPVMDETTLLRGYARLLAELYDPEAYYQRCMAYIDLAPKLPGGKPSSLRYVPTLIRTVLRVGLTRPYKRLFWRLIFRSLTHAPHTFAWAVGHAVMGEHLIRYTREDVVPRIQRTIDDIPAETPKQAPLTAAEVCA